MSLNQLYQKVAEFESHLSGEVKARLQCAKGCSRCCYTDLSVFEIEAANIRHWFHALSNEKKAELRAKWVGETKVAIDFHGNEVSACTFLKNESCTIYEARPLICRTQGMAMKFAVMERLTSLVADGDSSVAVDICPLNEGALEVIEDRDVLNLDLLNRVLGQMETFDSQGMDRRRISLRALQDSLI